MHVFVIRTQASVYRKHTLYITQQSWLTDRIKQTTAIKQLPIEDKSQKM